MQTRNGKSTSHLRKLKWSSSWAAREQLQSPDCRKLQHSQNIAQAASRQDQRNMLQLLMLQQHALLVYNQPSTSWSLVTAATHRQCQMSLQTAAYAAENSCHRACQIAALLPCQQLPACHAPQDRS
jgi:hypothetical protein